jgi:hypothetical protein
VIGTICTEITQPFLPILFSGPDLPQAKQAAAMVPTPNGTGVVLIGGMISQLNTGKISISGRKELIELKCSSTSCKWSQMKQQLSVNRWSHIAFYVPDSYAVCEKQ